MICKVFLPPLPLPSTPSHVSSASWSFDLLTHFTSEQCITSNNFPFLVGHTNEKLLKVIHDDEVEGEEKILVLLGRKCVDVASYLSSYVS